jgi:micrococcal nuclease
MMQLLFLLLSLFSFRPAIDVHGEELQGMVVSIADGDTFSLLTTNQQKVKIRLSGIDAPEKGQDYYRVSKDYLGSLLKGSGNSLRVVCSGKDKYGRFIGEVFTPQGVHINLELVKAGLAWHFVKYSNDAELAAAEEYARKNHLGLWHMADPQAPWDYRQMKKQHKFKISQDRIIKTQDFQLAAVNPG